LAFSSPRRIAADSRPCYLHPVLSPQGSRLAPGWRCAFAGAKACFGKSPAQPHVKVHTARQGASQPFKRLVHAVSAVLINCDAAVYRRAVLCYISRQLRLLCCCFPLGILSAASLPELTFLSTSFMKQAVLTACADGNKLS